MRYVALLVWWFAVIAPSGEPIFMEWRYKDDCEFQRRVYLRVVGLKVTSCVEKRVKPERGDVG